MRETRTTAHGLREAIRLSGYYPDLVADAVESALDNEPVLSYLVHHEATFDPAMEVRRHITVLVLSSARLLVCHTDEHPPSDTVTQPHASTTTEVVGLSRIQSVQVMRVVPEPASYVPGTLPTEVVLTIGWGTVSHLDLEPASCGDESCEADHGYTGSMAADDLSLRMSQAADGPEGVRQLLAFAKALSEATARLGG
ncbi:MAG: phosphodiesterase [Streptosporangiales bacterium]|nr:phosphodiesterase [Streptosporangiales bacterium]